MAVFPVYLDVPTFVNLSAHNVEVASLIGGNTTLTGGPYAAGVTSLSVVSATGFGVPTATAPVEAWIQDGLNSEIVYITNIASTTLTLQSATVAAHIAGVAITSGGTQGSLADIIHQASRELDNICQQGPDGVSEYDGTTLTDRSLYAISRTEMYEAPYGGAMFNVDNALTIYPYHFPVRSVAAITAQVGAMTATALSQQYLLLPNGARQIVVPYAQTIGTPPNAPSYFNQPFSRAAETFISLTYTAGPINGASLNAVPSDIQRACMFLTLDILAQRKNPLGAANVHRGDESYMFELRGDFAGKSLLWKDAKNRLRPYIRER